MVDGNIVANVYSIEHYIESTNHRTTTKENNVRNVDVPIVVGDISIIKELFCWMRLCISMYIQAHFMHIIYCIYNCMNDDDVYIYIELH